MKVKLNTILGLAFALLALQPELSAAGEGTRGGGDRIGAYLRDLRDQGTCIVTPGKFFAAENTPGLESILNRFSRTHWIFAWKLQQQINSLKVCMVKGKLKRIRTTDLDEYVYYSTDNVSPVAIRDGDMVYIERGSFQALNGRSRDFLMIHEAMHAFIPMDEAQRNHKVRNIVYAISEAAKSPMGREMFTLQLEHSNVQVVREWSQFDSVREDFLRAAGMRTEQLERMRAAARILRDAPEGLIGPYKDSTLKYAFLGSEVPFLYRLYSELSALASQAFKKRDFGQARSLIADGAAVPVDDATYAIEHDDLESLQVLGELDPKLWNSKVAGPRTWIGCETEESLINQAIRLGKKRIALAILSLPEVDVNVGISHSYSCMLFDKYPGMAWKGMWESDSVWHTVFAAIDLGDAEVLRAILRHPRFKLEGSSLPDAFKSPWQKEPAISTGETYYSGTWSGDYMKFWAVEYSVRAGKLELAKSLLSAGFACKNSMNDFDCSKYIQQ